MLKRVWSSGSRQAGPAGTWLPAGTKALQAMHSIQLGTEGIEVPCPSPTLLQTQRERGWIWEDVHNAGTAPLGSAPQPASPCSLCVLSLLDPLLGRSPSPKGTLWPSLAGSWKANAEEN